MLSIVVKRGQSDHFTRLARQRGYPARSVFKLEEMQNKFALIRRADRVLDVGASPGSWSLYLSREWGVRLVGVDLLTPDERLRKQGTFLKGDILNRNVYDELLDRGPYDVVVSDAAPSTTGSRVVDTIRSLRLARRVWEIAGASLVPGGNLLVKIFQGGKETELLKEFRSVFRVARTYKPKASRQGSFEIYLLGLGFSRKSA